LSRFSQLREASVPKLVFLACTLSLAGLLLIAGSVLFPKPLIVIGAMSVGHTVGGLGFLCYATAVLLDVWRASREPPEQR
jgi:hypothetical protein